MALVPFDNTNLRNMNSVDEIIKVSCIQNGIPEATFCITKSGSNGDIDSAAEEDIWCPGGTRIWLDSSETMDLVSDSANDTAAGTGARTVLIKGLDANYDTQEETITMAGLTPVTTINEYILTYEAIVSTAGSNETNVGNITIDSTTTAASQGNIVSGNGECDTSHFIVPRTYTLFVVFEEASIYREPGGVGERRGEVTRRIQEFGGAIRRKSKRGVTTGTVVSVPRIPHIIPEKSKLWYSGAVETNNTTVSVTWGGVLISNDYL